MNNIFCNYIMRWMRSKRNNNKSVIDIKLMIKCCYINIVDIYLEYIYHINITRKLSQLMAEAQHEIPKQII